MPTRNFKTWAAIAEIISAVAVVFSLIYVGLEIRRTTVESDADIQAELLSYTHQRRILVIENDDLSRILVKGYDDLNGLNAEELIRFQYYVELHFVAWERHGRHARTGCVFGCQPLNRIRDYCACFLVGGALCLFLDLAH